MRGGRSCARAGLRDGGGAGEVGLSRMRTPRHSPRPGSTAFSREERREARGAASTIPWLPSLALEEDVAASVPSLRWAAMRSIETHRLLRLVSRLSLMVTAMPM